MGEPPLRSSWTADCSCPAPHRCSFKTWQRRDFWVWACGVSLNSFRPTSLHLAKTAPMAYCLSALHPSIRCFRRASSVREPCRFTSQNTSTSCLRIRCKKGPVKSCEPIPVAEAIRQVHSIGSTSNSGSRQSTLELAGISSREPTEHSTRNSSCRWERRHGQCERRRNQRSRQWSLRLFL